MTERFTEQVLQELLEAKSLDDFIGGHEFSAGSLAEFLDQMLRKKGLKRSRVVRMADLNETFGYQIFTGQRNPSRNKVLQIAFAMALSLREANRALMAAGASSLDPKCRRDAIIIFCLDQGCSLQKVNEELYRLGEETVC
ncbi:XRE family transcriptional regulator [Collinsella sp. BA40]|uniref:XRE family transcriptional regulator n=1 Tax=Collinsella sp. BA40 TaxID=2560852 RepID=UPI0011C811FA|nr:XRE family transcriptional regulator [Collinsella sp. BA40]TXF34935.1 XRE family transcriptional regulator [Collinsella sp. BA40]